MLVAVAVVVEAAVAVVVVVVAVVVVVVVVMMEVLFRQGFLSPALLPSQPLRPLWSLFLRPCRRGGPSPPLRRHHHPCIHHLHTPHQIALHPPPQLHKQP